MLWRPPGTGQHPPAGKKKPDVFGLSWVLYWVAAVIWLWAADVSISVLGLSGIGAFGLIVAGIASWTVQRIRKALWKRRGRKILSDLRETP